MEVKFTKHALPRSFISMMSGAHALNNRTLVLLKAAFDCGGYIGGGFGIVMADRLLGVKTQRGWELEDSVRHHLGSPRLDKTNHFPFAGSSDIDVWFPDENAKDRFFNYQCVKDLEHCAAPSFTGAATEYVIPNDARVQIITRFMAPIEEQLATFDIYNAMVGLTEHEMLVPEGWVELENERVVHVASWASPWTPNRVIKYLARKRYKHLSPQTGREFAEMFFKAAEWCQQLRDEGKLEELKEADKYKLVKWVKKAPRKVQGMLYPMLKTMTNEQLLKLSALFPAETNYDLALSELRKRAAPL